MKKLLLSLMVLVLSIVLLAGCSGTVAPEPPSESTEFIGWWFNVDVDTDSITQIHIEDGETLAIHVWGKCHPTDCYWGYQIVPSSDALDGIIEIVWVFSFAEETQELMLLDDNNLKVTTFTHFTDGSGRPDYETIDYFKKK